MKVAEGRLIDDVDLGSGFAGGLGDAAGQDEIAQRDEDQSGAPQVGGVRNTGARRRRGGRRFQRDGRAVRREPGQFGRAVQEQAQLRQSGFARPDDDDFRPFKGDGCQKDAHRLIP
ncbi:hypothetical protein D3C72_1214930 [compost metagenome]